MKIKKFDQFKQLNEFYTGDDTNSLNMLEDEIKYLIGHEGSDKAEEFAKSVEVLLKKYFNKTTLGWKIKEENKK